MGRRLWLKRGLVLLVIAVAAEVGMHLWASGGVTLSPEDPFFMLSGVLAGALGGAIGYLVRRGANRIAVRTGGLRSPVVRMLPAILAGALGLCAGAAAADPVFGPLSYVLLMAYEVFHIPFGGDIVCLILMVYCAVCSALAAMVFASSGPGRFVRGIPALDGSSADGRSER